MASEVRLWWKSSTYDVGADKLSVTADDTDREFTDLTVSYSDLTTAGFAAGDEILVVGRCMPGGDIGVQPEFGVGHGSTFANAMSSGKIEGLRTVIDPRYNAADQGFPWFLLDKFTLATNDNLYVYANGGSASGTDPHLIGFSATLIKWDSSRHIGNFNAKHLPMSSHETAGVGTMQPDIAQDPHGNGAAYAFIGCRSSVGGGGTDGSYNYAFGFECPPNATEITHLQITVKTDVSGSKCRYGLYTGGVSLTNPDGATKVAGSEMVIEQGVDYTGTGEKQFAWGVSVTPGNKYWLYEVPEDGLEIPTTLQTAANGFVSRPRWFSGGGDSSATMPATLSNTGVTLLTTTNAMGVIFDRPYLCPVTLPANTNGYLVMIRSRPAGHYASRRYIQLLKEDGTAESVLSVYSQTDNDERVSVGALAIVNPTVETDYYIGTAVDDYGLGAYGGTAMPQELHTVVAIDLDAYADVYDNTLTGLSMTIVGGDTNYDQNLTQWTPSESGEYLGFQEALIDRPNGSESPGFYPLGQSAAYASMDSGIDAHGHFGQKSDPQVGARLHHHWNFTPGTSAQTPRARIRDEYPTNPDYDLIQVLSVYLSKELAAAGGTIHTKVLTDSATISENPEPRRYRDKELSDAETLEDAIKRIYSWRKELSDTVEVDKGEPPRRKVAATVLDAFWNLTDTAVAQIIEAGSVEVRQLLDSLTPLNDAHIKEFLRFREALDTLGLTDTLRRALNRKMGDAVAVVSDTTSLRRDRLRRIADELDVLDALDPRRSRFKTISETLLVTELPTRRAIYRRLLDVLVTTDNRIAQYIPAEGGTVIGKVLSDTILLPDDLMVQRQFARELLETLELADLANAVTTRQRVLSEATSAVDSALKFLDRRRVLAETAITLSDSAHLGPSDRLRQMLDVFDVFDAFEAYRQRYRVLIESGIGVSDEAIATYLAYTRVRVRPVVGLRRPINFKDR